MSSASHTFEEAVAPFIGGALSQSESDAAVEVINPSDGQRCFSIPAGSDGDVDRAVVSARRAFEVGHWSEAPPSFRKQTLHHLADLIEKEAATLDALDAGEMGKPVGETFGSATEAAGLVRFYAE